MPEPESNEREVRILSPENALRVVLFSHLVDLPNYYNLQTMGDRSAYLNIVEFNHPKLTIQNNWTALIGDLLEAHKEANLDEESLLPATHKMHILQKMRNRGWVLVAHPVMLWHL